MAEIELSVFSNQCLSRRISDEVVLKREVSALEHERNQAAAVIDWRFSTQDARTKLQHIYPSYSDCNGTRFTVLIAVTLPIKVSRLEPRGSILNVSRDRELASLSLRIADPGLRTEARLMPSISP